jgi:hypothetical protein
MAALAGRKGKGDRIGGLSAIFGAVQEAPSPVKNSHNQILKKMYPRLGPRFSTSRRGSTNQNLVGEGKKGMK